jgi:PEGA domain
MRLHATERYQTADEMLVEVERVLRTEFQSAGQTELKSWLEQLGRRDNAPSIGKAPRDTGGVINDVVGTDLSVGTSFELRDLEQADRTELQRGRTPPPESDAESKGASKREDAPPRSGHTAEIVKPGAPAARRSSGGFWLGVILTLGAVVGARYLLVWAEHRGVMTALGIGGKGGNEPASPPPVVGPATPSTPAPIAAPPPVPTPAPPAQKLAAGDASAAPVAGAETPDAHPAIAEAPPAADKPAAPTEDKKPDDQETDEEALLRKADPNAENAVIGEDEAEAPARPRKPAPLPPKRGAIPGKPSIEIPHVETAVLHITSAPAGAVVKTKARVLGRTPIALHFKTGNTYEIVLIKSGYEPATRKVAVHSTADRKIAVALKKVPPPKHSFFHPHR